MPVLKNAKHERFAQELAQGKTADEAYVLAGYKENRGNAATLKANQSVLDRLAEILERAAERVEVDKAWVIERLVENANRAMQAEAAKDREGNPTGEYRYEGSVANRALELVGKHLGMFKEDPADKGNVTVVIQQLTDARDD